MFKNIILWAKGLSFFYLGFFMNHTLLADVKVAARAFEVIKDETNLPRLNQDVKEQKILRIKLNNQLEVYLVSDPQAKQGIANLTVQVGSWHDPDEHPGLAHFLEHMLFLGTTKYPIESEFTQFLSEHGGETNAYTYNDFTSYCFAVNNSGFKQALDRFFLLF